MKDKFDLEQDITAAVAEYAWKQNDTFFTGVARIKCSNGAASVSLLEPDDDIKDIVHLAIQEYFNTDKPKVWAENNRTAFDLACFAAQLAQILKPKLQQKERRKRC